MELGGSQSREGGHSGCGGCRSESSSEGTWRGCVTVGPRLTGQERGGDEDGHDGAQAVARSVVAEGGGDCRR